MEWSGRSVAAQTDSKQRRRQLFLVPFAESPPLFAESPTPLIESMRPPPPLLPPPPSLPLPLLPLSESALPAPLVSGIPESLLPPAAAALSLLGILGSPEGTLGSPEGTLGSPEGTLGSPEGTLGSPEGT